MTMDPRHPTTLTCPEWEQSKQIGDHAHYVHEPFDGENLERERFAADRPFGFTPWESGLIVSVCLIAIGAALYAANAAQGIPT
jgi:hypothetical protein